MRVFSKDLLANSGQKMEVSDWSEPIELATSISAFDEYDGKAYFISSNSILYKSTDLESWTYSGSVASSITNIDYAINYRTFPTTGNWKNCKWVGYCKNCKNADGSPTGGTGQFYPENRRSQYGASIYYGTKSNKGVYTYSLGNDYIEPIQIDTPNINKMVYIHEIGKFIAVCNTGYICIFNKASSSKIIEPSTGGLVVHGDISYLAIHTYPSNPNIITIGDKNWNNVVYGNNRLIITSEDGWLSQSFDRGLTWSEPIQKTELSFIDNKIYDIVFACNKFYLVGSRSAASYDCKKYHPINHNSFPIYKYICYLNGKVVRASEDGYISIKTWKAKE